MFLSRCRTPLLVALCGILLAACGFQLRGSHALPFKTIFLGGGTYSTINVALKRQIEAGGTTQVVATPGEAEVQLQVIRDGRSREITSLNAFGKVREYELRRYFDFRLVGRGGQERIPVTKLFIRRHLTYDDNEILAKEAEEGLLYKEMDEDLVRQLLRRLAAAQPAAPAEEAAPR
ncbi:MAG: hypothetical protein JNM61_12590 [Zoogloeaceae bacterium]|nr:hypothetical protein [Zoogloeaceae bacterium]